MGNLFCSQYAIHRRFDLKGSTFGRTTDKSEEEIEPTTTLKDLDLNYIFRLRKSWFQEFCRYLLITSRLTQHAYQEIQIVCSHKFVQSLSQSLDEDQIVHIQTRNMNCLIYTQRLRCNDCRNFQLHQIHFHVPNRILNYTSFC